MKKHILVITQYFYPEPFRINDICKELVKSGYKVTVLTGIPNYPEGKFYKGYGWFKKRKEVWNGVNIIRLPLISRGRSSLRLILNYYSFVVSGWFWNLFTRLKADCVFTFEVSPLIQAKIACWYAKKHKVPNYLYVQDLWPDNLEIVGNIHNKFVLRHYDKMARKIYEKCDKIFATSPSFVDTIRDRIAVDKDKVSYLPQYAEEFYKPTLKKDVENIPDDNRFKVVFTGNIGQAQGLDVLPDAARLLKAQGVGDVLFVIVGDGRDKDALEKTATELFVDDMFLFVPRQPADKIPSILSACDLAFVSFMNNSLFNKTIPAKLQSYMSCGMPVVAAVSGETKRIIEEANCGFCGEPGDAESLAENVRKFIAFKNKAELAESARKYYLNNFAKEKFFDRLISVLNDNADMKNNG